MTPAIVHEAEPEAAGQLGRSYLWRGACSCGWKGRSGDYQPALQAGREHIAREAVAPRWGR